MFIMQGIISIIIKKFNKVFLQINYLSLIYRFTEESFATLIAVIFIKKSIENVVKVIHIFDRYSTFLSL